MLFGKVLTGFVVLGIALVVGQEFESIKEFRARFTSEIQLGIDLGTTQSVAAVCVQGNVSVVQVDGSYLTPSTVWFSKNDEPAKVGQVAVKQRSVDPDYVIYAAKRVMGLEVNDPEKEHKLNGLPFNFDESNSYIGFNLPDNRVITPEEVGSLVLKKLKLASEQSSYLDWLRRMMGFKFKSLTVSVPVTFGEDQKRATYDACKMAGFKQIRFIEEPIAAAMAYGLGKEKETNRVLVFDIGGGTLDIALLSFNKHTDSFLVDNTAGDGKLGGEDFDIVVANLVLEKLNDEKLANNIKHSSHAWQKLLINSERAKRELSDQFEASICLPSLNIQDSPCQKKVVINREEFGAQAQPTFKVAINLISKVLREGGIKNPRQAQLDVVLVGGTSRIPAIRQQIEKYLPQSTLHYDTVDPDQAVAVGAAKSWGCNYQR